MAYLRLDKCLYQGQISMSMADVTATDNNFDSDWKHEMKVRGEITGKEHFC